MTCEVFIQGPLQAPLEAFDPSYPPPPRSPSLQPPLKGVVLFAHAGPLQPYGSILQRGSIQPFGILLRAHQRAIWRHCGTGPHGPHGSTRVLEEARERVYSLEGRPVLDVRGNCVIASCMTQPFVWRGSPQTVLVFLKSTGKRGSSSGPV